MTPRQKDGLRAVLLEHAAAYPQMEPADFVKLIYQNEFGCEHMGSDGALDALRREYESEGCRENRREGRPAVEEIGGGFCRVYLDSGEIGEDFLPVLAELFRASARLGGGSAGGLREKLSVFLEMAAAGLLPAGGDEAERFVRDYVARGCPPLHHSDGYRRRYAPHYRVIRSCCVPFFPAFRAVQRLLEEKHPVIAAVDGRCASGKSFFAELLSEIFSCEVYHMDDFFLPPRLRTRERLSAPGGNVDSERFRKEVLEPIRQGKDVEYRAFDCSSGGMKPAVLRRTGPLSVVEGSYSMHPALAPAYDLRVFLTCSPQEQRRRLLRREGETGILRFEREWIPLEERYFSELDIARSCDFIFDTTDFIREKD